MKLTILVGNHHLKELGGSEVFTYTLIAELLKTGHEVHYFSYIRGLVSDKIEMLGAKFYDLKGSNKTTFDLALISHQTLFRLNIKAKRIIQTCHGLNHPFEQPSIYADRIVAISERVAERLLLKRYSSLLIRNGIDCERFKSQKDINPTLKNVLSLCQNEEVNSLIQETCNALNLNFSSFSKTKSYIWDIETEINKADLVFTLGRGACESLACGRNVLVYDHRVSYQPYGEGMITPENIDQLITHNFSGSYFKKEFTTESLVEELKKFNPAWAVFNRNYALAHLNIEKTVQQYLSIPVLSWQEKISKKLRIIYQYLSNVRFNNSFIQFDEYEGFYKIQNSKKTMVIDWETGQKIVTGKIKIRKLGKFEFHKFELIHE